MRKILIESIFLFLRIKMISNGRKQQQQKDKITSNTFLCSSEIENTRFVFIKGDMYI